jgi:AcrR family transcriptional regulator
MNVEPVRRSPREELQHLTRRRAMEAVAKLMRAGSEVTFDLVAREAGIPQRTLYRHFENKDALLGAFWLWANDRMAMPAAPMRPEELAHYAGELFRAFERDEPLVRALMHDPLGRDVRKANAEARRLKFERALEPVLSSLGEPGATRLLASITAICSANGWEMMKDNWGLGAEEAAGAARWAVTALVEAAQNTEPDAQTCKDSPS